MKPLRVCGLILLLCAFVCSAAATEMTADRQAEADAFFHSLFEKSKAVGGVALVAQGGQRLYQYTYGYADKAKTKIVTEKTVFKVASVSKLITAIGVLQLVDAGKLQLDAPLSDVIGAPVINPRYPDTPVTLRQVMSHTSSISESAAYATAPRWAQIDRQSGVFRAWRPGTRYEYANLNGGILGSLIERASGQSLNAYMTEHVFSPLGINAAYAATLLPDQEALSSTFTPEGKTYRSAENYLLDDADYDDTCNPDVHYRASVGSLYISAEGLETLAMALAGKGEAAGVRLLSWETVWAMRQDQATLPGSSVTGESPYGLNLFRLQVGEDTWYGHQGRWEGMLADVFFERETQTVLVLITNGVKRQPGREVASLAEKALDFLAPWTYFIVDFEE